MHLKLKLQKPRHEKGYCILQKSSMKTNVSWRSRIIDAVAIRCKDRWVERATKAEFQFLCIEPIQRIGILSSIGGSVLYHVLVVGSTKQLTIQFKLAHTHTQALLMTRHAIFIRRSVFLGLLQSFLHDIPINLPQ
ncbi:hypothetical protein SAY86_014743 [Trapa natans]|uniref:Uncharacterized protein n=1 Tax=Trapa natans TaxID=22666 RepID=A0AAN7KIH8_TRANT|nr:hypothetical protein SAY86_014743 [Trapa natans]